MPGHDLGLGDPFDGLGPDWDTRSLAGDDEMPWQAGALVGAGDVRIFGEPAPRWRRIGPRGVGAVIGAMALVGLAGVQATHAWRDSASDRSTTGTTAVAPAAITDVPTVPPTLVPPNTAVPTTAPAATIPPTTLPAAVAAPAVTAPAAVVTVAPTTVRSSTTAATTLRAPVTAAPSTVSPSSVTPKIVAPASAPPAVSTTITPATSTPTQAAPAVSAPVPIAPAVSTPPAARPPLPVAPVLPAPVAPQPPVSGQTTGDAAAEQSTPAPAAAQAGTAPVVGTERSTAQTPANTDTSTPAGTDTSTPANTDTSTPANTDPGTPGGTDPSTAGPSTAPPTGATPGQPIHATTNTNVGAATTSGSAAPANVFEPLRNNQAKFSQFAGVPSNQLDMGALTVASDRPDNGPSEGEGQFRTLCEYSHLSYDDPIVFPDQPGRSHLHMFFGNTNTDAFTTTDSLVNSGGGTCDGFELNRSAYWFPALVKGNESVIAPYSIVVYYKTKNPGNAVALPQGLKLVAGNPKAETFDVTPSLYWSCGPSGGSYNQSNRIPNCGTDFVNATIQFANCWDGTNLDSPDHVSHVAYALDDQGSCPASHPKPIPQISILLYWKGTGSVDGWHLSSDNFNGFNTGPGATLHADWFGGWNDQTMQTWMDGCIKAVRNCSGGQTGTDRVLAPINGLQIFEGDPVLPLPAGSYQMG